MLYADVIVDISHEKLDRSFQYLVPREMEDEIHVGMVAAIPFGNGNKERKGYVTGLSGEPKYDPAKIKSLLRLCSGEETTESRLVSLAAWMKERYGSTMAQALKTVLPVREKIRHKEKRLLYLRVSREQAEQEASRMEKSRCRARARVLRALLEKEPLDCTKAAKELGMTSSVLKPLLEQELVEVREDEVYRIPAEEASVPVEEHSVLSDAQKEALDEILAEWENSPARPVLLYGVTGSGKTQVYMKLIEKVISSGRQVIVLIPEIALTYQTVRRFTGWFGDKVSVLNSVCLPESGTISSAGPDRAGSRSWWDRVRLFLPLFPGWDLSLWMKSTNLPIRVRTAQGIMRGKSPCAVGRWKTPNRYTYRATPSLEAYTKARQGEYLLVKLTERYRDRPLPEVSVVDLREELKSGNRSVLSRKLKEAVQRRLERGEQAMLFLNRRGYAGFVSCRSCGEVLKCPHCDVALSEHSNGKMICHYCGYERPSVKVCPVCGSPYIGGFKAGTQQIEAVLRREFPDAGILRMDYDTTRARGSYEQILASFAAHEADILVGTQMIVKGHDFPDVTLVGVIAADLSLNEADYRCGERTFQLLTQAVGRSGRGRKTGEAVIQTYHPDHYSIQAAAHQDYERFYEEEMGYRILMDYPPAAHMLTVLASGEGRGPSGERNGIYPEIRRKDMSG